MTSSSTSPDVAADPRAGSRDDRLRVEVVVDGPVVTAAAARAIDGVVSAPVDVVGVRASGPRTRSRGLHVAAGLDAVDRALTRPTPDARQPVDLRDTLAARLRVRAVDAVAREPADVVLDLTTHGLDGRAGTSPRLGVWSLRFGRDRTRLGATGFLAEYAAGAEVGTCELLAERPGEDPQVLYRSVSALDPFSPARTRNEAAWKAADFPARVLTRLSGRPAGPGPADGLPSPPEQGGARTPATVVPRLVGRGLREGARRLRTRRTWFVAVRAGGSAASGADAVEDAAGFRPIVAPADRFYADPFVVRRPEGAYVFVEDGPLTGGPARLSVVPLAPDGTVRAPARPILERPTHLSYPFVFRDGDDWFLLPETAGTATVELLRAREFPWTWEPYAVLLEGVRAWDPTLLRHDGTYWLFVNMAAPGARPSDELCLYSAPALPGPWRAHAANPVVTDARRARPAGRVLRRDGALLRPAQDASGGYGRRIVLNRIDRLTADEYRETPVASIEPGWLPGVVRTHTYTADADVEVLDGQRYERRYGRPRPR